MYRDDLDFEERWLLLTKYVPSALMFVCLWAIGAPIVVSFVTALLFALLGWLALYKHLRGTIAALTVAITMAWLATPADTKQSIKDLVGEAKYSVGFNPISPS
ncbi:hypothetical protein ASF70_08175 [Rhizobium sp. Leaf321]|jgi:hypothetical protein|uniref:hypothetical protein n=1 Tax=unclassified Rhizobium TaxID=2613769 RepID=UPI0007163476|nr:MULTISPECIES: hypothetical protein [unclassified Rhizobium]KQQ73769.1 hypothetical protein ASF70_08175 [Rhizobium sp. Leaf321]MBD8653928.1 hypothetical protein [Rhizobium sp. CFBP 13726]